MRSLRVRRGRVSVVTPARVGWLMAGGAMLALYLVVAVPLTLHHAQHGDTQAVLPLHAAGALVLVVPGMLVIMRLGMPRRTPVLTLLSDDDVDAGVLLAVIDARAELAEFLVRPVTAGRCRAALGAPPPAERC